ncbi:MAG: hypothetical protein V1747_03740 [Candidatus Omnitrophota bacterium]
MNNIFFKTIALVLVEALLVMNCAWAKPVNDVYVNSAREARKNTLAPKLFIGSLAFSGIFVPIDSGITSSARISTADEETAPVLVKRSKAAIWKDRWALFYFTFTNMEKYLLSMPFVFLGTGVSLLLIKILYIPGITMLSAIIPFFAGFSLIVFVSVFLETIGADKLKNEKLSEDIWYGVSVPQFLFATSDLLLVRCALTAAAGIMTPVILFCAGIISLWLVSWLIKRAHIPVLKKVWFSRVSGQALAVRHAAGVLGNKPAQKEKRFWSQLEKLALELKEEKDPQLSVLLQKAGGVERVKLSRNFGWGIISANDYFYIDYRLWNMVQKNPRKELVVLLCGGFVREITINERRRTKPKKDIYYKEIDALIAQVNYFKQTEKSSPGIIKRMKKYLHYFGHESTRWKPFTSANLNLLALVEVFSVDEIQRMPELYAKGNTITQLGISLITEFIQENYADYAQVSVLEVEGYFHAKRSCRAESEGLHHIILNPINTIGGFLRRLTSEKYTEELRTVARDGVVIVEEIEKRLVKLEEFCHAFKCTLPELVKRITLDVAYLCGREESSSQSLAKPVRALQVLLKENKDVFREKEDYYAPIAKEIETLQKSLQYLEKIIDVSEVRLQPTQLGVFIESIISRARLVRMELEKKARETALAGQSDMAASPEESQGKKILRLFKKMSKYELEVDFPREFINNESVLAVDQEKLADCIGRLLIDVAYQDMENGLKLRKIVISGQLLKEKINLFVECKGIVVPDRVFMLLSFFYFHYHYGRGTWLEELVLSSGEKTLLARSTVIMQLFKLIEAHGGELNMNQDADGTVFIITLPIQHKRVLEQNFYPLITAAPIDESAGVELLQQSI